MIAAGERSAPRGVLTVTAPLVFGRLYVRPLVDAYLDAYRLVQARLLLLDRVVSLIDEGIDAAIRIGHLPEIGTDRCQDRRGPPGGLRESRLSQAVQAAAGASGLGGP